MKHYKLKTALQLLEIFVLSIIHALTYIIFIVDNKFAPAGLSGIATMIQYKLGFSLGYMSLLYNVPLCVFAIFKINRKFGIYSLFFCVCYSLWYLLFQRIDLSGIKYDAGGVDTIFPCLIAGFITSFVYARCYALSASTGGTDIISKYVCKRNPYFNFFYVTLILNVLVAISSLFVYSTQTEAGLVLDYRPVCLCLTYCGIANLVSNVIIKNGQQAYLMTVVSEEADEIEKEIRDKLHHAVTRVNKGIYTQRNDNVLFCVINKHQLIEFEQILKKYPDAFSYVSVVNRVFGHFRRINYLHRYGKE